MGCGHAWTVSEMAERALGGTHCEISPRNVLRYARDGCGFVGGRGRAKLTAMGEVINYGLG